MMHNKRVIFFPYKMLIALCVLRIADASSTAHLDKVERGYENMDHYKVEFKREGKALRSIDFIQGDNNRVDGGSIFLLSAQTCNNLHFYFPSCSFYR